MKEDLLFGKYRILKLLANGGGGEVFLAEHIVLGERRIVKRLLKNRPFYEERRQEAHTLQLLHHAAIPRIYDIEEDESACYIIEEDMGGETLFDFLFRQKCLPTSFISHYSIQLCEIIEYLHQNGILYLDVKPENIIIRGDTLALIDFGGSVRKAEFSGVMFGTQGYAAPEQYKGQAEESADIYGIGRVLGTMLGTGGKGRKELVKIYERCVQENPAKRYPSVAALREALERISRTTPSHIVQKHRKIPGTIGVIGVHEGAESGAFCSLLAAYLNDRGKGRIACIDMSNQHIFERLYESLFGSNKTIPDRFLLQEVCYVAGGNPAAIGTYIAQGYTTIILHFGELRETLRGEFLRCDSRFALGTAYPWRLQDWKALSACMEEGRILHDITAVLTGGEKELLPVRFGKVIELPYVGDILLPDKDAEKVLRNAF